VRAFVALPLPERQRALLAAHLAVCRSAAPEFRWVPPESLHLTLRFLGHVEPIQLERLRQGLREVRGHPFDLALGGLSSFGGRRAVRVVWLGLHEGAPEAAALAQRVEAASQAAGLEAEARPFRGHVTLARARAARGSPLPELPPPPHLAPWTATEFVLFESRLGRPAATYLPLERFPLEG
jgi:2'-5' RNA ligase